MNLTKEAIIAIQNKLNILADGVYGKNTTAAIKEWQKNNGLTVDGVIGKITWNKMFDSDEKIEIIPKDNYVLKLKGHIPDIVLSQLTECINKFEINNTLRLSHFLAQCNHESMGFLATEENLNYSKDSLIRVFGKYFKTIDVEQYARKPEKIASLVYANRIGNGDEASKDGYKYRGRGYIQLTGKSNYSDFNNIVNEDVVNNPELVATKYALLSAAWFWNSRNLNCCADKGSSNSVVTEITKKVNGGNNGLEDRIKWFKKYHNILS